MVMLLTGCHQGKIRQEARLEEGRGEKGRRGEGEKGTARVKQADIVSVRGADELSGGVGQVHIQQQKQAFRGAVSHGLRLAEPSGSMSCRLRGSQRLVVCVQ